MNWTLKAIWFSFDWPTRDVYHVSKQDTQEQQERKQATGFCSQTGFQVFSLYRQQVIFQHSNSFKLFFNRATNTTSSRISSQTFNNNLTNYLFNKFLQNREPKTNLFPSFNQSNRQFPFIFSNPTRTTTTTSSSTLRQTKQATQPTQQLNQFTYYIWLIHQFLQETRVQSNKNTINLATHKQIQYPIDSISLINIRTESLTQQKLQDT